MDPPLVSILVTVFNKQEYVVRTVRSALDQTSADIEVIAVDDGSTDDSGRLLEELASGDERLRVIAQPNQGPAAARNRAFHEARGEFVCFLDGDDLLYPNFVQRTVGFLRQNKAVDIVHTSWDRLAPDGKKQTTSCAPDPEDYLQELCLGNIFAINAVMSRRSFLERVGRQRSIKTEDWEYWARCAKQGAVFGRLAEPLAAICEVPESDRKIAGDQERRFFEAIPLIFDGTMSPQYERLKNLSSIRHHLFLMEDYLNWGMKSQAGKRFDLVLSEIRSDGGILPQDLRHLRTFMNRLTPSQVSRLARALKSIGIPKSAMKLWLWRSYDGKLGQLAGPPMKRGIGAVYTATRRLLAPVDARMARVLTGRRDMGTALRQGIGIADVRRMTLGYVDSMRMTNGSTFIGYRHSASTHKPVLYATIAALLTRHLYGVRDERTDRELEFVRSFQAEDGLFRDPVIACPEAEGEDWWGWRHLTLHALMALALYHSPATHGACYPMVRFGDVDSFRRQLATRDWGARAAWTSNEVQNYGVMLQYARDHQESSEAARWLDVLYEVVYANQDAETGLYGHRFQSPEELSNGVQAGYHLWLLYFYDRRAIPYAERIVDQILKTQNPLGGYGVSWHSSACEDIDSIDPLARFAALGEYRRNDIEASLQRALPAILQNLNADGGWVFRRHEALRIVHKQMSSGINESNMFYTWFRTLGLAMCLVGMKNVPANMQYDWNFGVAPGQQFLQA